MAKNEQVLLKVLVVLIVLILLINAAVIVVAVLFLPNQTSYDFTVDNSVFSDLEHIGIHYIDDLVPFTENLDNVFSKDFFKATICLTAAEIIMSCLILISMKGKERWRIIRIIILAICIVISVITIVLFTVQTINKRTLENPINMYQKTNESYIDLKQNMTASLHNDYTSDKTDTENNVSNSWNSDFFIKRNCCAVNPINSTTNDFDTTPWCTTSGDCQQTNSQIPKTCCESYSAKNPSNTNRICHEYVKSGFYKEGCFKVVKEELQSRKDVYIQQQKEKQKEQNKYLEDVTIYWKRLSYIKGVSLLLPVICLILSVILNKKHQSKDSKTEMNKL
ncbi:uncharacterized protein LOC133179292 [Saccostrea echinata]|uniref:uncharacterized protein LOC133179292 n=1 Tax=Saccostrea echinata TaxID=191078 RepID=UPI002A81C12D|nr:uncharacterized protein LOC133179292 [Saccostrea echinata]